MISTTLSGLLGKHLDLVRYVVLPESPEPAMRASASWDEVEYAIELVFDGLPMAISWRMENEMECLSVRSHSARDDTGLEVVADLFEAVALGGVDAEHGAADAGLTE